MKKKLIYLLVFTGMATMAPAEDFFEEAKKLSKRIKHYIWAVSKLAAGSLVPKVSQRGQKNG